MSLTFSDEDVARCRSLFPIDKKYKVIYADPPWEYASSGNLKEKPYRTMTIQDLKQLPVADISDKDCALFLWTANPLLDQAIEVMKAWGFKFKTVYKVWTKRNSQSGTPAITPGYWSLSSTELILLGVKGAMQKYKEVFNDRQEVASPRGRHSEKPHFIRDDIRRLLNVDSRLEIFSRHICDEWDAWGLDVPGYMHYCNGMSNPGKTEKVKVTLSVTAENKVFLGYNIVVLNNIGTQTETYTAKEPKHKEVAKKRVQKATSSASKSQEETKSHEPSNQDRIPVVHKDKGIIRGPARPTREKFETWWNGNNRETGIANRTLYTVPEDFLNENPDIKNIVCKQ